MFSAQTVAAIRRLSQIRVSACCNASLCLAEMPRLALMPSGDQKAGAIVELMEVELAGRDEVVLLDRANIETVLKEQSIALDGMLSADRVVGASALLQCDVFAAVHYEAATQNIPAGCSVMRLRGQANDCSRIWWVSDECKRKV